MVQKGDRVYLAFELADFEDTVFDKSVLDGDFENISENEIFSFIVGRNEVFEGWDSVIIGCEINKIYTFRIPYSKAYGTTRIYHDIKPKTNIKLKFKIVEIQ